MAIESQSASVYEVIHVDFTTLPYISSTQAAEKYDNRTHSDTGSVNKPENLLDINRPRR